MRYKKHKLSVLNFVFGALEKFCSYRILNLPKTLYLNFRMFPFYQAYKLPIFVFGRLKIISLIGRAEIKGAVKTGMIQFGDISSEELVSYSKSIFSNQGIMLFHGPARFYNGFCIRIQRRGTFSVGSNVSISSNASIYAKADIHIERDTRFGSGCTIISSDLHFLIDTDSYEVHNNTSPITIGANNWIANNVKINKGAITPDWSLVASGSLLNKDYSSFPENSFIGGTPAKLLRTGIRRVFSLQSEALLMNYFEENPTAQSLTLGHINIDNFCKR